MARSPDYESSDDDRNTHILKIKVYYFNYNCDRIRFLIVKTKKGD